MITLTATKIGTMFYYIVSTFTDGAHRIASSLHKKLLYLALALLAPNTLCGRYTIRKGANEITVVL